MKTIKFDLTIRDILAVPFVIVTFVILTITIPFALIASWIGEGYTNQTLLEAYTLNTKEPWKN